MRLSSSSDYAKKIIEEHSQLKERLGKLIIYMDTTPGFARLEEEDQYLLRLQREAMVEYLRVLSLRIIRFE